VTPLPEELRRVLLPGETVRWHGAPSGGGGIGFIGWVIVAFGAFITWVMVTTIVTGRHGGVTINDVPVQDPLAQLLVTLLPLLFGIGLMSLFPIALLAARWPLTAVTDQRVIQVHRWSWLGGVTTVPADRIASIAVHSDDPPLATLRLLRRRPSDDGDRGAHPLAEISCIVEAAAARDAIEALRAAPRSLQPGGPAVSPDPSAVALLQDRLQPGERVIWAARPIGGVLLSSSAPVSLLGLLMAAPLLAEIRGGGTAEPVALGFAAFLTLIPFMVWLQARRGAYAITDRRVLALSRAPVLGYFQAWPIGAIATVSLRGAYPGGGLVLEHLWDIEGENGRPACLGLQGLRDPRGAQAAFFLALASQTRSA
jgi:hypothetical protein